ncbi:hypothetical protein F2P56_022729 [Juglans regia]|uniref:Uncharacterized protein n=1 Tax=Juglans regia TaxID=51240 RepID=A0A833UJ80_JUGRE|nr:hypothetical protein F2P56_022729 [Juglans regia]
MHLCTPLFLQKLFSFWVFLVYGYSLSLSDSLITAISTKPFRIAFITPSIICMLAASSFLLPITATSSCNCYMYWNYYCLLILQVQALLARSISSLWFSSLSDSEI